MRTESMFEFKDYLRYEPETGNFYWLKSTNNKNPIGTVAGSTTKNGYISIGIGNKRYLAHRLAFYFVYGKWPKITDHINRKRNDNRIINLREVDDYESNINRVVKGKNKSGFRGVTERSGNLNHRFRATAKARNGKQVNLGHYKTAEEAHQAYLNYYKSMGIIIKI